MTKPSAAPPFPTSERSISQTHRVVLVVVAAILILAEFSRFPVLLDSFRGGDTAADAGGVVSFVFSALFAVQIFRGRWLFAAMCFLALFLAIEVWATLQMPVTIGDIPFRYPVFLSRLPFMLVHLVCLAGVFFVRHALSPKTRNAEPGGPVNDLPATPPDHH